MDYLTLTEEQKAKLRECGQNMLPPSEVAFYLECDEYLLKESLRTVGSEIRNIYMTAFVQTSMSVHKVTQELAEAGSPSAIADLMRSHSDCINELEL